MHELPPPPLPDFIARLLPFRRYATLADGHQIHVMESGQGRPVLCVHGNPTWGFLYRKVASELAGHPFRVIMPDLVGLGLSDKPRSPRAHTLDNHTRWLGALVDALDLEDVILVVQDWGGPIGLGAFVERAPRLAGIVILNTVVGPPRPGFRPTAFHRFSRAPLISDLAFRGLGFPQVALDRAQGDRQSIRGDVARAYRWPLERFADRAAPLALARMVPDSLRHPSVPALERCQSLVTRFSGPTAIVWGDRDPVLGRVRRHLEKLLPAAPVTVTQAGHFLQEEVPGEIAEAIVSVSSRAK
ncbi:MAG: alpha/beta fold hydrolase [Polyangiaceae bacterium]|nr:alpha/beta fold hydrolase [Polyangiaceae bacterium]